MSKFAHSLNLSEITQENHGYRNVSMMDLAIQNTNESGQVAVDVLLEKNGNYLGVDLVGYPGYSQAAVEINRQQILERVGIRLVPVGYVEWQIHQVAILDGVEKLLN